MIIQLKAAEGGKVTHEKQPGSIINQGDLLASLELKDPSKVKKILPFDGKLSYEGAADKEDTVLQAFRSSRRKLELVMDGYVMESEPLVAQMLSALGSIDLVIEEMQDTASTLGNKLPTELADTLDGVYAEALKSHVQGEDSKEVESLTAKLVTVLDDFIAKQYEVNRAGMTTTLAPVRAVVDKYALGLREHAISVVCALLQSFKNVESHFEGSSTDQAVAALLKANPTDLDVVYRTALAHTQLKQRSALAISLMRQLFTFPERFGVAPLRELPQELDVVVQLSQMDNGGALREVALTAAQFGLMKAEQPFDEVVAELKAELISNGADSTAVSRTTVVGALAALFSDPDVGTAAMEVAVKRFYRTFAIESLTSSGGVTEFTYRGADKAQDDESFPLRYGQLAVVPTLADLDVNKLLAEYKGEASGSNVLHIALTDTMGAGGDAEASTIATASKAVAAAASALKAKGVKEVSLMVPNPPKWPRQFAFLGDDGFAESAERRDMYPTMWNLLELERVAGWAPVKMNSINHNTQVLLGEQGTKPRLQQRLFVRGVTHSADVASADTAAAEATLMKSLDELQLAELDSRVLGTSSSHLFLHVLAPIEGKSPEEIIDKWTELMSGVISRHATRLLKLRVDEIEVRVHAQSAAGAPRQAVRLMASSMGGQWLKTDGYLEFLDPVTGTVQSYCSVGAKDEEVCFLEPYPVSSTLANKRAVARRIGTTYAYDFLGLIEKGVIAAWQQAITDGSHDAMPTNLLEVDELLMKADGSGIERGQSIVGSNTVGMVGWITTLKTPEYPEGRPLVIVANDCTVQSGSFGVKEDEFFDKVSKFARANGYPRLHIASNSGARIGLAEELKPYFKVAWNDPANEANGYKYLYLTPEDAKTLGAGKNFDGEEITDEGEKRFKLDFIVGEKDGLGVENLRGSGLIAGETSSAYAETFTLSYVTGRSVGIGAYINRLAQRVIQMANGPIILTGFSALNKLLGKEVYVSQDQLGGPQIMLPNGVAHQLAVDDQDGVEKILRWLSYVPKTAGEQASLAPSADPVDRAVTFTPTKAPYDPRHMLAGAAAADGSWQSGFFDAGSFTEYLADWGKSVVVGRAKLGGIPMGVIAVETRLVEQRIPADPANPASRETVQAQAGQVWYPDSAFKTAQAIADFNNAENLPLIVFANWRGFSGGTRDMFGEVLKFGSYIVDNLRTYKHPVFAYIPPGGELRGGAWVVIDPTINEDMMEMYAETDARGGILEPPGICDVKYRKPDLLKKMHQLDSQLAQMKEELKVATDSLDTAAEETLNKAITARENQLLPLYLQISHEFADLHDRPGRMKAKGVIRDVVPWASSREYFYWRLRRRLAQDKLVKELKAADADLDHGAALATLKEWTASVDWEDDKAVLEVYSKQADALAAKVGGVRAEGVARAVAALLDGLPAGSKADILKKVA